MIVTKKCKHGGVMEGEGGFLLDCLEREGPVEKGTLMLNSDWQEKASQGHCR